MDTREGLADFYSVAGRGLLASFMIRFTNDADAAVRVLPELVAFLDASDAADGPVWVLAQTLNVTPPGTPVPSACGHSAVTWLQVVAWIAQEVADDIANAAKQPRRNFRPTEAVLREHWTAIRKLMAEDWERTIANSKTLEHVVANLRAEQLRAGRAGATPPAANDDQEFLPDLEVQAKTRIVSNRFGTAEFGGKNRAWQLFSVVHEGGRHGKTRDDIRGAIWGNRPVEGANLDIQKGECNKVLEPLRLEIAADCRSVWRLAEL